MNPSHLCIRKSCDPETNAEKLLSLYAYNQFIYLVPSLDFEEQKEFRRGTQAGKLIDYFAKHFHNTTE